MGASAGELLPLFNANRNNSGLAMNQSTKWKRNGCRDGRQDRRRPAAGERGVGGHGDSVQNNRSDVKMESVQAVQKRSDFLDWRLRIVDW